MKLLRQDPEKVKELMDNYFAQCDSHLEEVEVVEYKDKDGNPIPEGVVRTLTTKTKPKPYTINGLAIALGITDDKFLELSDEKANITKLKIKAEVHELLIWSRQRVKEHAEKSLYYGKSGAQFILKNIGNWKDKTEVENKDLAEGIVSLEKVLAKALSKKK